MKFNCGMSKEEKLEAKKLKHEVWHQWFAWQFVRVGETIADGLKKRNL